MKIKCNLRIAGLVALLMTSINTLMAQNSIYSLIDPAKSRGYAVWQPVENASYKVEIYEKNETYQLISTNQTSDSYYHFDPLIFTVPNLGYKIIAVSKDNPSVILAESDIVPNNNIVGDPVDYETICTKTCNGRSYAWALEAYGKVNWLQQWDEDGEQEYTLGNIQLRLSDAVQYYNPQTGDYTPYWQPISQNTWDNMGTGHPYKQFASPYVHLYMKLPVSLNLSDGPFFDAMNNAVVDGMLVEKKLDQFNYMNHASTVETASATSNVCIAPITGAGLSWANFFNNYMGDLYNTVPTSVQPFAVNVPDGIECLEAYGPSEPGEDGENWNEWVLNLYAEARAIEEELADLANGGGISGGGVTWDYVLQEFERLCMIKSVGGNTVHGIYMQSVSNANVRASMYMDGSNRLVLNESAGDLSVGVYSIGMYTTDGNVISSVMEFTQELPQAQLKDFSNLSIFPNPIEDNILKIKIGTSKDSDAQLFVHNLFGDQVYSEYLSVTDETDLFREIDVQNIQSPLYQLKVTLVFADGSVLQSTASTVQ